LSATAAQTRLSVSTSHTDVDADLKAQRTHGTATGGSTRAAVVARGDAQDVTSVDASAVALCPPGSDPPRPVANLSARPPGVAWLRRFRVRGRTYLAIPLK